MLYNAEIMASPEIHVGDLARSISGSTQVLAHDLNRSPRPMPEVPAGPDGVLHFTRNLREAHLPHLAGTLEAVFPGGHTLRELTERPSDPRFQRQRAIVADMTTTFSGNEHTLDNLLATPRSNPDWYRGAATRRADLVLTCYDLVAQAEAMGDAFLEPARHRARTLAEQPDFTLSPMMEHLLLRRLGTTEDILQPRQEHEGPAEIRSMDDVITMIDRQSADRMAPFTVRAPIAYAEVTQDGGQTWSLVQLHGEGVKYENTPHYVIPFRTGEPGFLAAREITRKPGDNTEYQAGNHDEVERNPVFTVTESWFANAENGMREVHPQTAEGKTFTWNAVQDLTVVSEQNLLEQLASLEERRGRASSYADFDTFYRSSDYVAIAKALGFHGNHAEAARVMQLASGFTEHQVRADDHQSLIIIGNIQRSRAARQARG